MPRDATFQLEPGERVLWLGRPQQGVVFRKMDLLMIPFSLLWGGFAFVWEAFAIGLALTVRHPVPFFIAAVGLLFVGMGLYTVVGRFWYDAYRRANIAYAVTDRHVLIATGGSDRKQTSLDVTQLLQLKCYERADGSGTIVFGYEHFFDDWNRQFPQTRLSRFNCRYPPPPPAFERIDQVQHVFELIRESRSRLEQAGDHRIRPIPVY